jgi:hypothetical protein
MINLTTTNIIFLKNTCVFHVTVEQSYVEDHLCILYIEPLKELSRPGFLANLSRFIISLIGIVAWWLTSEFPF